MITIPKVCEPKRFYHKYDDLPVDSGDSEFHGEHSQVTYLKMARKRK